MVPCSHTAWAASRSAGFWQTCNTQESSDTQGEFHISVLSPQLEEAGTRTQRGHVFPSTYNMLHRWERMQRFARKSDFPRRVAGISILRLLPYTRQTT